MPLYEYECKSCSDVVEILQRTTATAPSDLECPHCGGKKLTRVFSVPASPSVKSGGSLPISGSGESCGAPRCCGGGCQS
ncbi:zinc ribbon domain-containing protein [Rubripirellula amarantea]|uniref:Zinc ribbon domain protein n=1 Tax=Rubripirellula amarantea TaxID=2527999 RepID=A0A5C5WUB6_9BACT|nr:zinc ribbon domain-containing protein [Rubripirellula amarantea]MDA8744083.1 zinc ribbon domain-containing protein [Rubripirellula amarantea]TWT54524.1 Zinc ribbon domain protein [Rubripirellula amarantea]